MVRDFLSLSNLEPPESKDSSLTPLNFQKIKNYLLGEYSLAEPGRFSYYLDKDQERFVDNDKVLQAYVSGSLILMLALRFYYPYVSGLLLGESDGYTPEYIEQLGSRLFAEHFSKALGLNTIDQLRERLEQKRQQALSDVMSYWNTDITHILEAQGLMPVAEKVGEK